MGVARAERLRRLWPHHYTSYTVDERFVLLSSVQQPAPLSYRYTNVRGSPQRKQAYEPRP